MVRASTAAPVYFPPEIMEWEEGDPDKVISEMTFERMTAAGDGGTSELLAWIAVMGAVGDRKARTICYEPAEALRCGMGCVMWDMN